MITDKHFSDLDEKGYTVVENVVSPDDCDQAISEYRKWLECFGVDRFPVTYNSLIWNYNVAHLDTTWKLRLAVLEGSHKHLMSLFDEHPERADSARSGDFEYRLRRDDIIYFKERGCHARRVPVTKGGMALWDSRLVHAAARPLEGRKNAGRWRWATFVSMTPAIWANERDLSIKRHVYDQVCSTTHWSSQGVRSRGCSIVPGIHCPTAIPKIARSDEAKRLAGVLPYDFNDGMPTAEDQRPAWRRSRRSLPTGKDLERRYANGHL
ncbi:uncharacterized protein LOC128246413 isoform X2 [Mya arenaria]|uniref:uncharacterized protein LOC128246413 isoform X2 n=1 Tax=Mya arenaria TaxID=6604 RepID=UPI0022E4F41D|nr:uncharacterized protein LOC128246413 isoform X2 [Mya arenaria]